MTDGVVATSNSTTTPALEAQNNNIDGPTVYVRSAFTNTAAASLTLIANSTLALYLRSYTTSYAGTRFLGITGAASAVFTVNEPFGVGTSGTGAFIVGTNNTERVRVTNTGDVGIGTATPATKLHVAGALTLDTALSVANGGTGATTLTGVVIGNGTSAFTVKTNPSGAFVGTTDTQTLTGKTLGNYTETVFAVTDGATVNLDPNNGPIQTWTLGANRTPGQVNWAAGQSITLMVDDGSAFAITWTTLAVVWETDSGSAPTLTTTGFTVIVLWKVGTTIYGARVGNA
jgi:hypothetical protein